MVQINKIHIKISINDKEFVYTEWVNVFSFSHITSVAHSVCNNIS